MTLWHFCHTSLLYLTLDSFSQVIIIHLKLDTQEIFDIVNLGSFDSKLKKEKKMLSKYI